MFIVFVEQYIIMLCYILFQAYGNLFWNDRINQEAFLDICNIGVAVVYPGFSILEGAEGV